MEEEDTTQTESCVGGVRDYRYDHMFDYKHFVCGSAALMRSNAGVKRRLDTPCGVFLHVDFLETCTNCQLMCS